MKITDKRKSNKDKNLRIAGDLFPDLLSADDLQKARVLQKKHDFKKANPGKTPTSSDLIVLPDTPLLDSYDDDFDIIALMDSARDPVTGTLRDLKIDDRDLPTAKNFYDFSFNLNGKDVQPPWSRQLWTGAMLFGEVCPKCSDKKWLDIHNVPKDYPAQHMTERLCFLEHGICPKCKTGKWDLVKNNNLRNYSQLVNVLGQRSGKSSSAARYAAYSTHRYLKFPNISSLTKGIEASTELTATFVSLNFNKAVGLLWTPYKKYIENSEWFQNYFKLLDFYKEKYGKELYRNSSLYLRFFHKNLRFYPSGPRSSTLRGDTRILTLIDELGLFPLPTGDSEEDENSERANADEAHKSLMRSLLTVRNAGLELMAKGYHSFPPAVMMSVSSPYSQRDKVMRLLRESKTEAGQTYILGINLPTWEVNPTMERDNPDIVAAYNENYEKAERDYGANPPAVHSTLLKPKDIQGIFTNNQNSHTFKYHYDTPEEIYGTIQKVRSFDYPSLITIDAGHVNNSFTVVGGHYDFKEQRTVVTTLIECMAQEGRKVNFNLLYKNVILPLAKDLNAIALLADQWQSIDLLYRIKEDMGMNPLQKPRVLAKQWTPRPKDFDTVVAMCRNKSIIFPTISPDDQHMIESGNIDNYRVQMLHKPVAHLMLQMLTVKKTGESKCPTKGDGFTDDIFRALVLFASKLHDPKVMERLVEAKDWVYDGSGRKRNPMPVAVGRSGGGFYGTPFLR